MSTRKEKDNYCISKIVRDREYLITPNFIKLSLKIQCKIKKHVFCGIFQQLVEISQILFQQVWEKYCIINFNLTHPVFLKSSQYRFTVPFNSINSVYKNTFLFFTQRFNWKFRPNRLGCSYFLIQVTIRAGNFNIRITWIIQLFK